MSRDTDRDTDLRAGRPPFLRRHRRKLAVLLFWLVLLGGYQLFSWWSGTSPSETGRGLLGLMRTGWVGGALYVVFYAASRPLLFPPTLLTIAAGLVFGPTQGVVFAILGSNAAGAVAYLMGRYFGRGLLEEENDSKRIRRYTGWMRRNGFESVLLMRLAWTPFDPVSILAGFLRINWRHFALATFLGSLPCISALVLFGASVNTGLGGGFRLDPWVLVFSLILLAGSLLFSRWLKRRDARLEGAG